MTHKKTPWPDMVKAARTHLHEHGNLAVPYRYVTPEGVKLGQWLAEVRRRLRAGTLPAGRAVDVADLGLDARRQQVRTEDWLDAIAAWKDEHGHLDIQVADMTRSGLNIGVRVDTWRQMYRRGRMPVDLERALREAGLRLDRRDGHVQILVSIPIAALDMLHGAAENAGRSINDEIVARCGM